MAPSICGPIQRSNDRKLLERAIAKLDAAHAAIYDATGLPVAHPNGPPPIE
jgi:hypothetical protein